MKASFMLADGMACFCSHELVEAFGSEVVTAGVTTASLAELMPSSVTAPMSYDPQASSGTHLDIAERFRPSANAAGIFLAVGKDPSQLYAAREVHDVLMQYVQVTS